MRRLLIRTAAAATLVIAGGLALGARCIENTNVYVDPEGYTHLTGEMYNDTDIQGAAIMLRGTLFDAAGNVLAEKDSPICPPDLQPHSQVLFDIRFDNPGIPPHTSFKVGAISGKALDTALPDSQVLVLGTDAIRFIGFPYFPEFPVEDTDVFFRFDIRNRSTTSYTGVQGCSAVYNNQGQVIASDSGELVQFDEDGFPQTAILTNQFRVTAYMQVSNVPPDAAYVRAWLWFGDKNAGTSAYKFIMTPIITIQTDTFP
jgi:hypothetical protein